MSISNEHTYLMLLITIAQTGTVRSMEEVSKHLCQAGMSMNS